MVLLSVAAALLGGAPAGLIVGGISLLLIGSTTDDAQVMLAFRRGAIRARRLYARQVQREDAPASPHPPIKIDAETEQFAQRLAAARLKRGDGRMREATP